MLEFFKNFSFQLFLLLQRLQPPLLKARLQNQPKQLNQAQLRNQPRATIKPHEPSHLAETLVTLLICHILRDICLLDVFVSRITPNMFLKLYILDEHQPKPALMMSFAVKHEIVELKSSQIKKCTMTKNDNLSEE